MEHQIELDISLRGDNGVWLPPPHLNCDRPTFMVLTIKEGPWDDNTEGVFADIKLMLVDGIRNAMAKYAGITDNRTVISSTCEDLRFCKLSGPRFLVVLGSHHISRYTSGNKISSLKSDFPPKDRTALYNFEYIDGQADFDRSQQTHMWQVYDHYSLSKHGIWDYSQSNFEQTVKEGYNAKYLPLGFVESLTWSNDGDFPPKDIDVLFYGSLNAYRQNTLQKLRKEGVAVRHANAQNDIYGEKLNSLIQRSKIVVNLRYFDERSEVSGEWKMARFLRPLANGILIISERCGSTQEMALWEGKGIIFVPRDDLANTIKYYLEHSGEAEAIAREGKNAFQKHREEDIIWPHLRSLVRNKCPRWNP